MTWFEALPPMVIITLALGAMGSLQGLAHRSLMGGKDKKVQRDHFSHLMDKRDDRVLEQEAAQTKAS